MIDGYRHIIPISGKDSLATAIVQKTLQPELSYEYMFNRVGSELPETEQWLDTIENALEIKIERIGESLIDIIEDQGILPSFSARFCTRMAKIHPMKDWLEKEPAYVYFGLRADEQRIGYVPSGAKDPIIPKYPLVDNELGINEVWSIVESHKLLPPAFKWQKVYDAVEERLVKPIADYNLPPWFSLTLFAWRSRMNCFHCFYQRQYEWIGLYEYYPELFLKAKHMEETIGAVGFTWIYGTSLEKLLSRRDEIIEKRINKIVRIINKIDKDEADPMAMTSCGLFCGK